MRPENDRLGIAMMAASVVFYTVHALFVRYLGERESIGMWTIFGFRSWVGLFVTIAIFRASGELKLARTVTKPLLILRGLLGSVGIGCYYTTILTLGVGMATMIGSTYVLFAMLFASWHLGEKVGLRKYLWVLVACFGIALLTGVTHTGLPALGIYEGVAVLGAVVAGIVVVLIRRLHRTESTATIFAAQCVMGLVITTPLILHGLAGLSMMDIALLVACGLVLAGGQLTMTHGFRHLAVATGSAFQMSVPVFIAIGGVLLFEESYALLQIVGGGLIVVSCLRIISRRK